MGSSKSELSASISSRGSYQTPQVPKRGAAGDSDEASESQVGLRPQGNIPSYSLPPGVSSSIKDTMCSLLLIKHRNAGECIKLDTGTLSIAKGLCVGSTRDFINMPHWFTHPRRTSGTEMLLVESLPGLMKIVSRIPLTPISRG
jgi:hypothetical protein